MAKQIAILISVKNTILDYSNEATSGVDAMTNSLQYALRNAFPNVRMIQNQVRKEQIINSITEASRDLDPGGNCLIYFHGHGDSVTGYMDDDETEDQALVCYDGYLLDDELDQLLRKFHNTCRVITIMDCCSSETVIEWKHDPLKYPRIMHIASASDKGHAVAGPSGGLMSLQIINMIDGWAYSNYSYGLFSSQLKKRMRNLGLTLFVRTNPGFSRENLKIKLFK